MFSFPARRISEAADTNSLRQCVALVLTEQRDLPDGDLPIEAAEREGVLPWLGFRLQDSGSLETLPDADQEALRDALRGCNELHLACEAELEPQPYPKLE